MQRSFKRMLISPAVLFGEGRCVVRMDEIKSIDFESHKRDQDMEKTKISIDCEYLADNENDQDMEELNHGNAKIKTFNCVSCKEKSENGMNLCSSCLNKRAKWVKKRKRNKQTKYKSSSSRINSSESEGESGVKSGDKLCIICFSRPKNAAFIHGKKGHQVNDSNFFIMCYFSRS